MAKPIVVIATLASVLLSACTPWPVKGNGGNADRFTASQYYEPAASVFENRAFQQSELETLQAQLDVLAMQGANECLPASMKRLSLLSHRVRRQIEGGLLADAGHDLVIFQRELRYLRQQFITVAQQTGCYQSHPSSTTQSLVAMFSLYFDVDSAVLQSLYAEQLRWWVEQAGSDATWALHGYSDSDGSESDNQQLAQARVKSVAEALAQLDVKLEQVAQDSYGELEPLLLGEDAFSMGLNRRVDVYLRADVNTASHIPVQQWESLNLKVHRHLWRSWE